MIPHRPIITLSAEAYPFTTAYLQTVFLVPVPPQTWPDVFAIVTAYNPDGHPTPDAVNKQHDRSLLEHLRNLDINSFEVLGCSPDLKHREPGRAFVSTLETASAVSAAFHQEAFFWIEDATVYLCSDATGRGWKMSTWSERVITTAP